MKGLKIMNDIEEAIEVTNRQINELKSELKTLETQEYIDSFNLAIKVKELSVEALQEKAEREKGCECCNSNLRKNGTNNINNYIEGSRLTMKFTNYEHCQITSDFNDYYVKETDETHSIKINYCPMCGRKLGEENG